MEQVPIKHGYSIKESETKKLESLKQLSESNLIKLDKEKYAICNVCENEVLIDDEFRHRNIKECSNCSHILGLPNTPSIAYIVKIVNFDKIIGILNGRLKKIFGNNIEYDEYKKYWSYNDGVKTVFIVLYGVSNYNCLLSMAFDESIIIYLNYDDIACYVTNYNKFKLLWFYNSTIDSRNDFNKLMKNITYEKTIEYIKLNDTFSSFIKEKGWQYFEQQFVPSFVNEIKNNRKKFNNLLIQLSQVQKTLINSKYVKVGGSGQPDFFLIDIKEYLEDGFSPIFIGENNAYSYGGKKFTTTEFGVAVVSHAKLKETLIITSTDDIQLEVWVNIMDFKKQHGHYPYVLIDRDVLLLLINALDMQYLLK